jgi:hypothetical protein
MKRRKFLQLAGGAAMVGPLPTLAQKDAGLPSVAVLSPGTEGLVKDRLGARQE